MNKLIKLFAIAVMFMSTAATITSCNEDPCKDVVCLNSGTCDNGNCLCIAGYEGADCATLIATKFIGVFNGNETCSTGSDIYTLTVSTNSDVTKVNIANIYDFNYSGVASITGSTITLPTTTAASGAVYSGSGSVNGNTLTFTYTIANPTATPPTAANTCTFIGTK